MNLDKIRETITKIVDPDDCLKLELTKLDKGFEAEFFAMYERPAITFDKLVQISEAFGTRLIDLSDGRGYGGCDSCDYGSSYGVNIRVQSPTRGV